MFSRTSVRQPSCFKKLWFPAWLIVTVKLTLSENPGTAMLLTVEVEDTGIGADDLDRIFEYFETIGFCNRSGTSSTGLGLPIVKAAVFQMGGKLRVSSTSDIGSRFYFTIPMRLYSALPRSSPNMSLASDTSQDARIKDVLVVDDNDINLTLMCEMVRRMVHCCVPAANGQEAVAQAAANRFDAILMDFSMPVMDGPTASKHVRSDGGLSADAMIIGVTAFIIPNSQQAQLRVFDKVLTKPVGIAPFEVAIAQNRPPPAAIPTVIAGHTTTNAVSDDDNDLAAAFDTLATLVGDQKARELLAACIQEAAAAIAAITAPEKDLLAKVDIIHKAVGSTGLLGLTELSDTLSEVERLARDNKKPAATGLDVVAGHLVTEIYQYYITAGILT